MAQLYSDLKNFENEITSHHNLYSCIQNRYMIVFSFVLDLVCFVLACEAVICSACL
jgi:hypothetical protein